MRAAFRKGGGLRAILILTAFGSVAAAAANVTWHIGGHDRVIPPVAVLRAPAAPAETARADLDATLALAPFGSVAVADAPAATPGPSANLVLLGVIVRDDPARSLALIRVSGDEDNFRIGAEISPGTKITEIAQDHVVLRTGATDRILPFTGSEIAPDIEAAPTGSERLLAMMGSGQGMSISDQVDAAQRAVPVTTEDYIDMWRDRISANPAEVLDTIGLVPSEKGYIIAEKHDAGVNLAGLKAGDIVTSVNGQAVGNVEKDRALYDVIADSGLARIEVERNGRTIVMSFPLQ